MHFRRFLLLAVVTAVAACGAGRAQAQYGAGCAGGYGFGYGAWDVGRLYDVLSRNVPYYAAFPPVYYSVPVPRTYGYSPFAYPPGTMTPEVEITEPLAIINPYYTGASGSSDAGQTQQTTAPIDRTTAVEPTSGPQEILNPYVTTDEPAMVARR